MARKFGPFDTSVFYEVENRRLQRALNPQTGFVKTGQGSVTAGTGAQLVIAAYPDGALIDGLYVENPTSETVTLTTNSGSTNPRIDRLVLRLDMTAKTIAPFQIVGTPAASPSAPSLVQTANVYDMPLVQYRFPGSASAQNPGSIVDERVWVDANVTGNLSLVAPYVEANTVGGTPRWRRNGLEMALSGGISYPPGSYTAAAGSDYLIATLPPNTAPATDLPFSTAFANGSTYASAWVWIRASGQIQYRPHTAAGPGFSIGLSGINWRIGY